MRIVCDTQDEYNQLMIASRYLHDFIEWKGCIKKAPISLDQEVGNGMVGFLCHIYLSEPDFPNKHEIIQIGDINQVKFVDVSN